MLRVYRVKTLKYIGIDYNLSILYLSRTGTRKGWMISLLSENVILQNISKLYYIE